MKHVKTLNQANLKETAAKGGCGECQASCQSACKTSCTVANQKCEHAGKQSAYTRGKHIKFRGSLLSLKFCTICICSIYILEPIGLELE